MKSHWGGDNIVALAKEGSGVKLYPIPNQCASPFQGSSPGSMGSDSIGISGTVGKTVSLGDTRSLPMRSPCY